ncbi:MAG: DUF1573 domain-containing protein [Winogradskyella sp.]|uniref:DUF1573 domain-containing protein n=1 Tax=Winogradskyella sp. TaxID=1883156 RepID=UPI000F3D9C20|nr:DUF1573 domain-containing protein [Winogradskyella sp.]RNC80207.1 MAG: DUF1573 domain-containing protein [Winogradskyella sp.]
MKKVILGLGAVCMLAFTSCKDDAASKVNSENVAIAAERDANAGDLPVIKFDKEIHDFGTIENGTPVETVFNYTNTGNSMLVVSNVKSTCGCTVPSNYTKQVAPGETGNFTVKFNGKGNGNKVTKAITMTTNTAKGNEQVKITAFVEKDPNAPAKVNASTTGSSSILQAQPKKSSTRPGHEGHNHD